MCRPTRTQFGYLHQCIGRFEKKVSMPAEKHGLRFVYSHPMFFYKRKVTEKIKEIKETAILELQNKWI